jgi:hypothetical protein
MNFAWNTLGNLYAKLKRLELTGWIAHHEFAGEVLYSFASVIVWERAYWRYPDTPTPRLRNLLKVSKTGSVPMPETWSSGCWAW